MCEVLYYCMCVNEHVFVICLQESKAYLIPDYIYFNPSKQFVSSGKLFYREIKQSQQLNRTQSVSTQEALQHDNSQQCVNKNFKLCVPESVLNVCYMYGCFGPYFNTLTWQLCRQHPLECLRTWQTARGKSESWLTIQSNTLLALLKKTFTPAWKKT